MNPATLLLRFSPLRFGFRGGICSNYHYSTQTPNNMSESFDLTSVDNEPKYVEGLTAQEKAEILRKRHKSRLAGADRNRLFNLKPYNENIEWWHNSIRWKQRMLGRHGIDALDVPVGAVWPTKEEIEEKIEIEKTAYPTTLQENWALIAAKNQEEAEKIRLREELIDKNMKNVEMWEKQLHERIARKEKELLAAKERKERLVEEVRRHFGFKIDQKDARFKEVLEQKEKEDKKRKKEIRKQDHTAKLMAKLLGQSKKPVDQPKPPAEPPLENIA